MSDPGNPTTPKDIPNPSLRRSEAAAGASAPVEPPLDDLARKIKTEHLEITRAKKNIIERAMTAGDLLIQAKVKAGHGNWLNWLRDNCADISERTANVYMKLAEGRAKIEEKLKSAATADLTINEALRCLAEEVPEAANTTDTNSTGHGVSAPAAASGSTSSGSTKAKGGSRNPSDSVDTVTDRLIDLLKTLETETAVAAVAGIVKRFGDANWMPTLEKKKAA
jgi:Protein of unknown function (DUF3102)